MHCVTQLSDGADVTGHISAIGHFVAGLTDSESQGTGGGIDIEHFKYFKRKIALEISVQKSFRPRYGRAIVLELTGHVSLINGTTVLSAVF